MDIVRFEGQGAFHPLVQLEGRRVTENPTPFEAEQIRAKCGPIEPHVPRAGHPGSPEGQRPRQFTFAIEEPNGHLFRAGRNLGLAGLEQDRHTLALHLWNWRGPGTFPVGEGPGNALGAVRQQDEAVAFRMGRPEVELAPALQSAPIQGQVFVESARPTVDLIAAGWGGGREPQVEVVHHLQLFHNGRQQVTGFKGAIEPQLLTPQGVQAVQGERLDDKAEALPFVGPLFDGGIVPVDIARRLGDQDRILRIDLAQSATPVDRHIHPQHALDVLQLIAHPLAPGPAPGILLFVVVDLELALFDGVELNGEGLVIEGVVRTVKLQVAGANATPEFEIPVLPDDHPAIPWLDHHPAVARNIHAGHPIDLELAVEEADFPMGFADGLGPEEEHIVIPSAGGVGQVFEQLGHRPGFPRPQVHLQIPVMGHPDHHRPGFGLAQPNAPRQLLAGEGAVARALDVIPNPNQRVHRIDALHLLEHLPFEEVFAEQDGRGSAGTRRTLQPEPRLVQPPGQNIAIQGNFVVGVGERARPQTLVGAHQGEFSRGEVETEVQLRVKQAVRIEANHGFHPLATELLGAQDEQVGPALHQHRVPLSEIQRGRDVFIALSLQFRTADRQSTLEVDPGHDVRHGQAVDVGVEPRIPRVVRGLSRLVIAPAGAGFVRQLPEQRIRKQLGGEAGAVHRQAR